MAYLYGTRYQWTPDDAGGLWIWGLYVPAPYGTLFRWAYRKHDLQYQYSKKKGTAKDRLRIDSELKEDITRIAIHEDSKEALEWVDTIYWWVRKVGWLPWANKLNAID